MNPLPARLLLVTDRHIARRPLQECVRLAVDAGVAWVWLRDRDLPRDERRAMGEAVMRAIDGRAAVVVGGDAELARDLGAQGVHGGGKGFGLTGVSAHSFADVVAARAAGAHYATLSPIFITASKPGYGPALGPAAITQAAALGLPLVALGGVTPANATACFAAGAAGVAVMGGILAADDPAAAARLYLDACARATSAV